MKTLIAITLFLSFLPCFSQETKPKRSCRVIYLERPADAPDQAYLFDGSISHKVSLSGMNFSDVVVLPGGPLTVGMTPNPVMKPEDFPAGAPSIKITEAITDLYIIIANDPENKVFPIRMLPLDISQNKLKTGETLWVNLTAHQISAKLGESTLVVAPRGRMVGKAPLKASGYYKAAFLYQPEGQKEFLPVMQKSWWFDSTSKNLGFIIETGGRLPRIFTFRDFRPPQNEPPGG